MIFNLIISIGFFDILILSKRTKILNKIIDKKINMKIKN